MDRLDAMVVFAAVSDGHGFAAAARRLGLSPSVVTRTVAALEAQLGVRLLHRTTRAMRLTDAGERYLDQVRGVLAAAAAADDAARGTQLAVRGCIVVAAPVIFGRLYVAPLVLCLLQDHPEMTAELQLNDRNAALIEDGVDIAIRIGALENSGMTTRRLGETQHIVVASPGYLAAHGGPDHPTALAQHTLILHAPPLAAREWGFLTPEGRPLRIAVPPRLVTSGGEVAIDCAVAGAGLTRVLAYQVQAHLASGALVTVLGRFAPPPVPIQAIWPGGRVLPAKVRAFVDLLAKQASWRFVEPA